MTKREYDNLKHGDIVVVPERAGIDAGKECIVIGKDKEYITGAPLDERGFESTVSKKHGYREVHYKSWDIPHK